MADNGSLAFSLRTPGYGDIDLQNYNGDPDLGGDVAPAGQANTLFGFDIEGSTFTSVGDADGVSGIGRLSNGYPAEVVRITQAATTPTGVDTIQNVLTSLNASARETASVLGNVPGVTTNAFTYVELSNFQLSQTEPLQININGVDLVEYSIESATGNLILATTVPDPQLDPDGFNDYIADRINQDSTLSNLAISAIAGSDPVTGAPEIRITASEGDDINVSLTAVSGESIDVNDGQNPNLSLNAMGSNTSSSILVGGRIDVALADGVSLSTLPENSMLFGDTSAANFARNTYTGIQAMISGSPQTGDIFTLDFNLDAAMDNRNALSLADLESAKTIANGKASFGEGYAAFVETVGIETSTTSISLDASEQVLQQTTTLRDSISGVNLDEEAADLIKFEQMFAANAQGISVARDLFDRLISSL